MVAELKAQGIILHLHICGDAARITDDFISTGAQVLEIDHKTDPARIKAAASAVRACSAISTPTCSCSGRRGKLTPPVTS